MHDKLFGAAAVARVGITLRVMGSVTRSVMPTLHYPRIGSSRLHS